MNGVYSVIISHSYDVILEYLRIRACKSNIYCFTPVFSFYQLLCLSLLKDTELKNVCNVM